MIERYSRPELRALWSDDHRFATWLAVELAACEAMEGEGIVPKGQAALVRQAAEGKLSAARILEHEQRTRHDIIAFLSHVEELAGEPARWLHLGLTSSDIVDTSLALLLVEAGEENLAALDLLLAALRRRAEEHRRTPMIGRSHGIHAEPTTLGLALLGLYAEGRRRRRGLVSAIDGLRYGKLAGAVGAYGNVAPSVEAQALGALGLRPETVATQVVPRDRHAVFFGELALLGAFVERLALLVRHGQRTEVGEIEEAFGKGQKGSSAMPHKKNPILSENLAGLARLLRSYQQAAIENVALWMERDISHSSVERVIAPDATATCDFMLRRAAGLVEGLVFHPDRMLRNLELTGGLVYSEAVLLELVRAGLPRQAAYEKVQACALAARQGGASFMERLIADETIGQRLGKAAIEECFSVQHHLRHVDVHFARALAEDPGPEPRS